MRTSIYHNLTFHRSYSASTGLSQKEFEDLAQDFCALYEADEHHVSKKWNSEALFPDGNEVLFLLLYYKKVYPSFDVLALNFGVSNATAHNYIQLAKKILYTVLAQRNLLPKRVFETKDEFEEFFTGVDELLIDATERPIQRPDNQELQEESYSVKKNSVPSKIRS